MGRSGGAGGVFSGDTYFGSGRPWVDVMAHGAKGDGVTDDTVAVQAAVNTAGLTGEVVFFPPGKNFSVSFITPVNGLIVSGYGATITQIAGTQNAVFYDVGAPPATKSGFRCIGLTFVGEGTGVTEHQQSAVWLNEWNDVTIRDCVAKNFASGAFQGRNIQRWNVVDNTIINCCKSAGRNAINLGDALGSVNYTQDLVVTGNIVRGCPTAAVCVALGNIDNSSISGQVRAVISDNDVEVNGGVFAGIALELGASGAVQPSMRSCSITGNVISVTASAGTSVFGISVQNPGASNDQTIFQDLVISANQITSTCLGIRCDASRATIADNEITCNAKPIEVTDHGVAKNHISYVNVTDNVIHTTINPFVGLGLITAQYVDHLFVGRNRLVTDTGNSATSVAAIYVDNAGWFRVSDNIVDTAPASAVRLGSTVNDFEVLRNRVYNCNDSNGATTGRAIYLAGTTGTVTGVANMISDNHVVDDRGTSQTQYGIYVNPAGSTNLHAINNVIFGTLTAPTIGTFLELTGTRTTATPVPSTLTYSSALVTATNASWPIPSGAVVLRVTAVGGGGGGGGGGSSSAIAGQAGGAGGSSGVSSTQLVAVGANTTLNVTVGDGGGGGNGGAASGNLGSAGSRGSNSTVVGTGISVTGLGGGNGGGAAANSAAQVFAVGYGANLGNAASSLQGIAGTGAGGGNQGGAPFGYSGGAGGGGGTTSATLGGGAGGAGTATVGGAGGTTGTSGTTAGVVGADAAANTGGGGGGGGGGAWNGGTGPGAGGNGGAGGSGFVLIEVIG